jgi:hypothetical protein
MKKPVHGEYRKEFSLDRIKWVRSETAFIQNQVTLITMTACRCLIAHPLKHATESNPFGAHRFGYACGLSHEPSVWLRLNKMLLFYSRVTPKVLLFKVGEDMDGTVKVRNLMLLLFFICHVCACIWFYLGRAVSFEPKMTWVFADRQSEGQNFNIILLWNHSVDSLSEPAQSKFKYEILCYACVNVFFPLSLSSLPLPFPLFSLAISPCLPSFLLPSRACALSVYI